MGLVNGPGETDIAPEGSRGCIASDHDAAPAAVADDASRPRPDPEWTARPVVLVHGILGQELFYWNFLRRRLLGAGLDVAELTLPNLALGDLREAAVAFRRDLFELVRRLGVPEVDVVAHSAGGLVARYFLKQLTDESPIRRLVTLGTPHGGTRMASLLPEVGMLAQVKPGSPFIEELNALDPTPLPTRYTAMWTPYDGVVVPAESARLPSAPNVENVLYPGITHWGYLFGPRVARVLAVELRMGFVGGDRTLTRVPVRP